ncbi:MAG: response regulator [Lachnospiraceae bacterium]|nr:response regulator [Lachnospiraceae bacterium]
MYKVLRVDDETIVRKGIISEVDWGALDCAVVGEASNGIEGIEAFERFGPDIIISDIRMPKMDGIEMVRQIRDRGSDVSVIFLTAYSDFTYAQNAIKLVAADYLLKPFEDGELEASIERVKEKIKASPAPRDEANEALTDLLSGDPSVYIRDAAQYISSNCRKNDLSVAMIAEAIGLSEGHLSRTFKQETGKTLASFITDYRMCEAKRLLKDPRNKVYEVASLVGFKDITYFATTFKKHTGLTPTEYQKNTPKG